MEAILLNFEVVKDFIINDQAGLYFLIVILGTLMFSLAAFFEKANLHGFFAFIPVINLIMLLKMVGRPARDIWYFLIPGYNLFFYFKICLEICHSYGKNNLWSFLLMGVFNVFYLCWLGIGENNEYNGPLKDDTPTPPRRWKPKQFNWKNVSIHREDLVYS